MGKGCSQDAGKFGQQRIRSKQHVPSSKLTYLLKITHLDIVDLPSYKMVDLSIVFWDSWPGVKKHTSVAYRFLTVAMIAIFTHRTWEKVRIHGALPATVCRHLFQLWQGREYPWIDIIKISKISNDPVSIGLIGTRLRAEWHLFLVSGSMASTPKSP